MTVMILLAAAGLAAQDVSDETALEAAIGEALAGQQIQVYRVEMVREDGDSLTGFADVRDSEGQAGRLRCTARRNDQDIYDFSCLPAITDEIVAEIENQIRATLAQQGRVLEVEMSRRDDMHMIGYAQVQASGGAVVRTDCTATREAPESRTFNWECNPQD